LKLGQTIFRVGYMYDGERFLSPCEIYIRDGVVERIVEDSDRSPEADALRRQYSEADQVHEPDGFVLPGLINSHHHAYSALARGMAIRGPRPDFQAVLERLWWPLDRALDPEAVYLSALVTAIESVRHGCTAIVDHHSSPSAIQGSLVQVARAFSDLNLTATLCYETSDRNGAKAFDQSLEENLTFAEAHRKDTALRGMFGLHASFTLSDRSLKRIAEIRPQYLPVHVHVAEDRADVEHAQDLGHDGPLARLDACGLLDESSLIAHGVHLTEDECKLAADVGLHVAHNPESNLNNAVGYSSLDKLPPDKVLLGTDGMSSSMLASLHSAYLTYSGMGGTGDGLERARRILLDNPSAYLTRLFGRPVGRIVEGEPADLAMFVYRPPTPVTGDNWIGHLLFGLSISARAIWVYARGTPVLARGAIQTIDEASVLAAARESTAALWDRYREIAGA